MVDGFTQKETARLLHVSLLTVRTVCAYYETFRTLPRHDAAAELDPPVDVPENLTPEELKFISNMMEAQPESYLDEYVEALRLGCHTSVSISTMYRILNHAQM